MNSGENRWDRLEELFYAALELEPQARIAMLERECASDLPLRMEVESLLASSDKTLGFLGRPLQQAAASLSGVSQIEGQRIGRYRIERRLGEGGMGTVYLATRDESYQQQVALKLMHPVFGRSHQLLLRFSAERQILANLNHPNIARLLDGGMAPDGSPFLVMELIDGVAVDEYVAAHQLSIEDRLRLVHTICGAVGYAHRNLVVHRDIKPANILVTKEGVPKLLDFGIAKLLQNSETERPDLTRATERLMTPEYASPEQIRGEAVSTATDVYALGMLLYQLLTGRPAFQIDTRNPVEAARIICEQPPNKPSTALRNSRGPRFTEVKQLKGDLDNIVLRALRKEPERRYSSAEALAEDMQLYLQGYPIQAGSRAWTYRAEKFVKRHTLAVTAALVMGLAIVVFSVGMGVLAQRARRERTKAAREAEFLSSIFRAATPDVARGKPVMVQDLLDQGAKRIDEELRSEPEVQAAMLDSIGRSYFSLGAYERATPFLERAHTLRQQILGRSHPDVALTANALGSLWEMRGDYTKAEGFFRESVSINRSRLGEKDPVTIDSVANLGEVLYYESRDAEAEPLLRQTIADARVESQAGLSARNYLGLLLERKGAFEEAAQWLSQSAQVTKQLQGADSPDYITSLHNLAGALADLGDLPAAVSAEKEVIAIRKRVSGAHHPDLVYSLNNLGWFLLEEGDARAAEPYLREGLELAQQTLGPANPRVGTALNNWARVLQGKADYVGAEKTYRQALAIFRGSNAGESWAAAKVISNLGLLEFDRGNFSGAERFAQEALDMRRRLGGDASPDVASSLLEIGGARLFEGNPAAARPLLEQALAIREKTLPAEHPRVIAAETRLGMVLVAQGELTKAEELLRRAVDSGHRAIHPLTPWQTAESENALGVCLAAEGRTSESAALIQRATHALSLHPQVPFRKQPPAAFRFSRNAQRDHSGISSSADNRAQPHL